MNKMTLGQLVDLVFTTRTTHAVEEAVIELRELRVMFGQAANLALAPMAAARDKANMKGRTPPAQAPDEELAKQKTAELEASLKTALKERDEARDIATKVGVEREDLWAGIEKMAAASGWTLPGGDPDDVDREAAIESLVAYMGRALVARRGDEAVHIAALNEDRKFFDAVVKTFNPAKETRFMAPEMLRQHALEAAADAKAQLDAASNTAENLRHRLDIGLADERKRAALLVRGALKTASPEMVAKAIEGGDPLSPTFDIVVAFALRMEQKLDANRHKGDANGWRAESTETLLKRLLEEVDELRLAIDAEDWSVVSERVENVLNEGADVANFAMFIGDKVRFEAEIPF